MKKIKYIHYLFIAFMGILILIIVIKNKKETISFYGIAQSEEIIINYNLPVFVNEIYVSPGEYVEKGAPLCNISVIKTENKLSTNSYKIDELKAKESFWKEHKNNQINNLLVEKELKINELNNQINTLEKELNYKKSIAKQLNAISFSKDSYSPLEQELKALRERKRILQKSYHTALNSFKTEQLSGSAPLSHEIDKLNAELSFEESQANNHVIIYAPTDGLVGDILCKQNTFLPKFQSLLNFYKRSPNLINGYVNENLITDLKIGDEFEITSKLSDTIQYQGKVKGLGSRIIEIPQRLSKIPSIKTYGREVTIEITTPENNLLQQEKVILNLKERENSGKLRLTEAF